MTRFLVARTRKRAPKMRRPGRNLPGSRRFAPAKRLGLKSKSVFAKALLPLVGLSAQKLRREA